MHNRHVVYINAQCVALLCCSLVAEYLLYRWDLLNVNTFTAFNKEIGDGY